MRLINLRRQSPISVSLQTWPADRSVGAVKHPHWTLAVPLARDAGAKLFLLSAIEPAAYAAGLEMMLRATPGVTLVKNARAGLRKLARQLVPSSVPSTLVVCEGRAFDVITRVAQKNGINLIVLATHGRTGFDRVLMGSTTERVVRDAPCPVFIVRARSHEQAP